MLTTALRRHPVATRAASAGAAVLTVGATLVVSGGRHPSRDEVIAFEERFVTVAQQVGSVIEFGTEAVPSLKRGIGAVESRSLRGEAIERAVRVWTERLVMVRDAVQRLMPPSGLRRAAELFDASVTAYLEVAATLARARGVVEDTILDEILDTAVTAGSRGDRLFDRAAVILQDERRRVGLDANPSLPDRTSTTVEGVRIIEPGGG